ncbi:hypothetical protein ZTR_07603 [Talaromyces verruculosus]|nr:hypothetical protein ZTR_07603 [Talaromyces verruculosus]
MVSPAPHKSLHRAERRGRPRRKVPLACDPCRERKSRCDGKMPICAACERRSLPLEQCVYSSDNARSESNAAYIQSLHARIRHLEGVCLAANIAPYSSDLGLPADGIFAQDLPTGNESTVVDNVTALPSNFRDNVRETLTPLPRDCSINNLASPQANAQNGTNGQTPYVIDSERDRRQPSSLFELTSNITAMGAISAPEDDERARSPDAEYYGSSSTVEFMRLARKSIKKHRTAEIDRHANRPHPELDTSAIIREACTPSTRFAFEDTPLPPRALADHLLECFWDHVFCLYPFFHRPSFQHAYENLWVPHRQPHRKLTRSDIGLGSIWASDLQSPVFQSSLNIIFALGCHFADVSETQRQALSHTFFLRGVACRLAQGLGLHQAIGSITKDPLELEIRRCTWTVSMTHGRPCMTAHLPGVPLPEILLEQTEEPEMYASIMTFYVANIKLHRVLDEILSEVYGTWRDPLSETINFDEAECTNAAIKLIALIFDTYQSQVADAWWYNGFYVSTAGLVVMMSLSCRPIMSEVDEHKIVEAWERCNDILSCMATFSSSACNTLNFLQALYAQSTSNHRRAKDTSTHQGPDRAYQTAPSDTAQGTDNIDNLASISENAMPHSDMTMVGMNDLDDLGFLGKSDFLDFSRWFSDTVGMPEFENMIP